MNLFQKDKMNLIILLCCACFVYSEFILLKYWQNKNNCQLQTIPTFFTFTEFQSCNNITNIQSKCINNELNTFNCPTNDKKCLSCNKTPSFTISKNCTTTYLEQKYLCQNNFISEIQYLNNISISLSTISNDKCNSLSNNYYIPSETCIENYYKIQCFENYLLNITYDSFGCQGKIITSKILKKSDCIQIKSGLYFKTNQCNGLIRSETISNNGSYIYLSLSLIIILINIYLF
jgi:hypothetical protein